jgi:predicted permease
MPDWRQYVRDRLRLTSLREVREAEIVEDLARQLEDAYREARRAGATQAEARAKAEQHVADWDALARQLSGSRRERVAPVERWARDADDRTIDAGRRLTLGAQLRQDLVYGARALAHHKGLTAVAIVSLALGIGANTALFSVMHALLLRPLPVRAPQELVAISDPSADGVMSGVENGERSLFSYHEFEGLRDRSRTLSGLFAFSSSPFMLPVATEASADARTAGVVLASGDYFPTLGIDAAVGRVFGPDVDRVRLATPQAVVSHTFWRERLQQDPNVIGRTIRIRQTPFTIIGVLSADFTGIVVGDAPDIWVPLTMQQAVLPGDDWLTQTPGTARRVMFLHIAGRLPPGASFTQAGASLDLTFRRNLEEEGAGIADAERRRGLLDAHVVLKRVAHGMSSLRSEYSEPLGVLMALVGLLLLLACANVANLLLSRATGRERELAVRVALGAGRLRLIRQLLTESLLLAAIGAAVGLLVAVVGSRVLLQLVSDSSTPVPLDARLDAPVLAFTAAITLVTGLLFGLAPALRATRPDLNVVLRGTAHNISGAGRPGRWPLARLLVGAQVALSLILLVTAGLFVRSLQNLSNVPLGFDTSHFVMFRLSPSSSGYAQAAIRPLFEDLLFRMAAVPGVRSASLSANGLFYGGDNSDEVTFPGYTPAPGLDMGVRLEFVGPRYFETLGVPVRVGRDVEAQDGSHAAWMNESMSRYFFKDESPVGRKVIVHYSFADETYEIRGVVADSRGNSLRGPMFRRLYVPYFGAVTKPTAAVFEIRTAADPAAVVPELRRLVQATDSTLDPPAFRTVGELLDQRLIRDRLTARLSTFFGVMALLLASVGLYGVLSYSVSRRVSEIGVRMAFGAGRARILALVLREAAGMTLIGAVLGVALALATARFLGTLLYGLTARDPFTLAVATIVLFAVATLAAVVPAWRASRLDPLMALRSE